MEGTNPLVLWSAIPLNSIQRQTEWMLRSVPSLCSSAHIKFLLRGETQTDSIDFKAHDIQKGQSQQ